MGQSKLYTWSGELLRIDRFEPPVEDHNAGHKMEIHLRRGPSDYVPLYQAPQTRWEYSTGGGVETVTKFVGDLAVERRRFVFVGDERRPLTVEQLAPEPVTIEEWDWSGPDRVIVERLDGRDLSMLDCSELPPIGSLIDPDCPPPRPYDQQN